MRILLPVFLLAACSAGVASDADLVQAAHDAVGASLPGGAVRYQADHVVAVAGEKKVCGLVDPKDRFGTASGFTPYAYDPATKAAVVLPVAVTTPAQATAARAFPGYCRSLGFSSANFADEAHHGGASGSAFGRSATPMP